MLVGVVSFSLLPLSRVFARTEAGPEEDFGDHCVVVAGVSRPRGFWRMVWVGEYTPAGKRRGGVQWVAVGLAE